MFISSLAENENYQKIVAYLSKKRFATRNEILKAIKTESGGTLTKLLTDLELCEFIDKYTSFHLGENSRLVRYCVSDPYLQFYFKFVHPQRMSIAHGDFNTEPSAAISSDTYYKWLGFAFERVCRKEHRRIAKLLGFGSVSYRSGAFFSRGGKDPDGSSSGFQLDLVYERADRVYTICEIKHLRVPAPRSVMQEFESKLMQFPNKRKYTIQKVLISANGATKSLMDSGYFDRVITLEDLFSAVG